MAMEKFFAKYLGGRVQEDVRDDIRKRLDAITVNVKDVVLQPAVAPDSSRKEPVAK
jgi:hypothetical protein